MASHFAPTRRIEPVVIILAGVTILLSLTLKPETERALKPEENRTSNKVLIKG